MNQITLSALKRIRDVLREYNGSITLCDKHYGGDGDDHFVEHNYTVQIGMEPAVIGNEVNCLSAKELSRDYIMRGTEYDRTPHPIILSMLGNLESIFRDLKIQIYRSGSFYIDGVRQFVLDPVVLLDKTTVRAYRSRVLQAAQQAADPLFELADVLKKHKAYINWQDSAWPGGGHGDSVYGYLVTYAHFWVNHQERAKYNLAVSDALEVEVLEDRTYPAFIDGFMHDLQVCMKKHDIIIRPHSNDIYLHGIRVGSLPSVLDINWNQVYFLAQHVADTAS